MRMRTSPDVPGYGTGEHQTALLEILAAASPTLGEFYSGILYAMREKLVPNRERVMAYQARELMTRAPRVLALPGALPAAKPLTLAALRNELQEYFGRLESRVRVGGTQAAGTSEWCGSCAPTWLTGLIARRKPTGRSGR